MLILWLRKVLDWRPLSMILLLSGLRHDHNLGFRQFLLHHAHCLVLTKFVVKINEFLDVCLVKHCRRAFGRRLVLKSVLRRVSVLIAVAGSLHELVLRWLVVLIGSKIEIVVVLGLHVFTLINLL